MCHVRILHCQFVSANTIWLVGDYIVTDFFKELNNPACFRAIAQNEVGFVFFYFFILACFCMRLIQHRYCEKNVLTQRASCCVSYRLYPHPIYTIPTLSTPSSPYLHHPHPTYIIPSPPTLYLHHLHYTFTTYIIPSPSTPSPTY